MSQKGKFSEASNRDDLYALMDGGRPYKSYIKTILGKVHVVSWDHFKDVSVGLLLYGDPRKKEDTCIVDVWSQREDVHFQRMNKRQLEQGILVVHVREDTSNREPTFEESTDEDLVNVLNAPFFTLQSKMNKTNSEAVLFRLLGIARELDKSESIIKAIEARISEVQAASYKTLPSTVTEEL